MGTYRPLFSLRAEHEYFGDVPCRGLDFVPDAWSRALLTRAHLLIESIPGGVRVHYDDDRADALRLHVADTDEPFRIVFRVRASDPAFSSYTEPQALPDGQEPTEGGGVRYFSSRTARDAEEGGGHVWDGPELVPDETIGELREMTKLEAAQRAGQLAAEDRSRLDELRADPRLLEFSRVVQPRDQVAPPLGIVCIWIKPPADGEAFPPSGLDYVLRFKARRTIWRYHFLGERARDLVNKDVEVVPGAVGEGAVEFVPTEEGQLEDRVAVTFRSREPIALSVKPQRHFRLRESPKNGSTYGEVLINRLPEASPDGFGGVETIDEKQVIVSDIYING